MNKNNLSWVDNKVFNPGGTQNTAPPMRPYMDTAPAQYQTPPSPTGVSPATYQDTAEKAPATTGVSPAAYQDTAKAPTPSGVSPATYQEMAPMSSPQTGLSPATYQNNLNQMGLSPAQYQKDPVIYPVQTGVSPAATGTAATGMGMPGTLTRDTAYAPSPLTVPGPPTVFSPGYTPAYLKTQIGKRVRAEFNIGTNLYMDKTGVLREVGVSYLVLEDNVTHAMVMCDLYSLKFLTSV